MREVVLEFCLHKEGSRLLQDLIGNGGEQLDVIFEEIEKNLVSIANDQSGNYCIQKLLDDSDENRIDSIVKHLTEDILRVSMNS